MGKRIQKILEEVRQAQPIEELERKWNKAKGRHSQAYWCQEWLDLATARGREMWKKLNGIQDDGR